VWRCACSRTLVGAHGQRRAQRLQRLLGAHRHGHHLHMGVATDTRMDRRPPPPPRFSTHTAPLTSDATFFSFNLTASSTAISQNGFMLIFTVAMSTAAQVWVSKAAW